MKVFMICNAPLDIKNAETIHIIELFKNLRMLSVTHLFAPKSKVTMNKLQDIIFFPNPPYMPLFTLLFNQIILFLYLIYYCSKQSPDIIYSRHTTYLFSPVFISKIFQIPLVLEINGFALAEAKINNAFFVEIYIIKTLRALSYKLSNKLVVVTQGLKEVIIKTYGIPSEKIVVIENGANTDLFKPIDQKKAKERLKLEESKRYVCFVGILARWQGTEFLIQSAPLILKEIPNTRFLIVGDGRMKEKLMDLAKKIGVPDKIIFTGAVPYKEVPFYINASDVCAAPFIIARNKEIGLSPLKIYEYGACEKPVISSRIPNLEFVEEQNAGILVEPEKPEKLAKSIIKLLRDKKLREEMGKNGRDYIIKNHSWKNIARKVEKVCKDAIKHIEEQQNAV